MEEIEQEEGEEVKEIVDPMEKPVFTEQDFVREYEKLCEKGFRIVANPELIPTNHGTFEFQVTLRIAKI